LLNHQGYVYSLAFSPDSSLLASAGQDQVIRLWNSRNGTLLAEVKGHLDRIYNVLFSPDGSRLISAAQYEALRLWGIAP
jgi:WD40 repeat protein